MVADRNNPARIEWNVSILKMKANPKMLRLWHAFESNIALDFIFRFPIQFLSLERLYLLWLANKQCQKGNENEWARYWNAQYYETQAFFCTGAEIYTFTKRKKKNQRLFFSVFRAQSPWHNWTNSTESIYVDFGYQSAEPLYFHPFTIYAFYLYDFLFTKLQIFFCFVYQLRDRYLSLLWWVRRVLFFSSSSSFVSYIVYSIATVACVLCK